MTATHSPLTHSPLTNLQPHRPVYTDYQVRYYSASRNSVARERALGTGLEYNMKARFPPIGTGNRNAYFGPGPFWVHGQHLYRYPSMD